MIHSRVVYFFPTYRDAKFISITLFYPKTNTFSLKLQKNILKKYTYQYTPCLSTNGPPVLQSPIIYSALTNVILILFYFFNVFGGILIQIFAKNQFNEPINPIRNHEVMLNKFFHDIFIFAPPDDKKSCELLHYLHQINLNTYNGCPRTN